MKKLIAGNWKMNGLAADGAERAKALSDLGRHDAFEMVLCPPMTLVQQVAWVLKDTGVLTGGQDCHAKESGAFTGDVSAPMLKDLGCTHVILGHSERRQHHRETSLEVAAKTAAAHAAGLIAIVCVGEVLEEREAGKAEGVVEKQLAESLPSGSTPVNTVIAYEPVWAIGTGKVASNADILAMHAHIRHLVGAMRLLYGGSVKADGASEILSTLNVDGVLVGGASLKAEEFRAIALAAR